jgi:hypothetical protein
MMRSPRTRISMSAFPRRAREERSPRRVLSLREALNAFRPKRLTDEEQDAERERELDRFFDTGPKR